MITPPLTLIDLPRGLFVAMWAPLTLLPLLPLPTHAPEWGMRRLVVGHPQDQDQDQEQDLPLKDLKTHDLEGCRLDLVDSESQIWLPSVLIVNSRSTCLVEVEEDQISTWVTTW